MQNSYKIEWINVKNIILDIFLVNTVTYNNGGGSIACIDNSQLADIIGALFEDNYSRCNYL